jgi:hypothetical protein
MRIKSIIFIFSTLILFLYSSCNSNDTITIPNNLISQQKFTKLITDFLLAESATNLNIKSINSSKFDSVYWFNPLKLNNITKAQYDSAINFYSKHPQLYKQIYEDAIQLLSNKQTKLKTKQVADSLRTIKLKNDSLILKQQNLLKPRPSKKQNAK